LFEGAGRPIVISMVATGRRPRTGDFSSALRSAIQASGLSLDRIQYRLRQRGVPVTVTSLSYWQSGRRRPERPESMTALAHLEQVLGLVGGSLIGLLGPPRPRGRRPPAARSVPLETLWRDRQLIVPLLSEMRDTTDSGLKVLSLHDRIDIDADRCQRRMRVRQVVQAERDGVDRWVSVYDVEHPGQPLPRIVPLRSCRLGQVAQNRDAGVHVTEWLFDRTLVRGDTLIMEFELVHSGQAYPRAGDAFTRMLRQPVRQYIGELHFHPAAMPAFCRQYETRADGSKPTHPRDLSVDAAGHAHTIKLDTGPGACCLIWGWDTAPAA
jgi:hypothetical protein